MEFEWDEAKNQSNIAKHGIDFADAKAVFDSDYLEYDDHRFDYREVRKRAVGPMAGTIISIAFTERDGRTRLISARRASRQERKDYEEAL